MPYLIDIHSHILPGLDDGPKEMAESIEMCRAYAESGFGQVLATPHWITGTAWTTPPDRIAMTAGRLRAAVLSEHLPLTLHTGMEIGLADYYINPASPSGDTMSGLLPLGTGCRFLIEAPLGQAPAGFRGLVSDILLSGKGVVLAHPERSPVMGKDIAAIQDMIKKGVLVQMNAGSLLGHFGPEVRDAAVFLLKTGCVHFLASDAHCAKGRRGVISTSDLDRLEYMIGTDIFRQAFAVNPSRLLARTEIPPLACASVKTFEDTGWTSFERTSLNVFWARRLWGR